MKRKPDQSLPRHAVLSQRTGYADSPRDIHWLKQSIPCQEACPAGTDIPEYLAAISRGDYRQAYAINLIDNIFPAILGRVCSRPCESFCRHGWEGLGEPVAICFSKRSTADFISQKPIILSPIFAATGKKIAIIGAGVAGLTVARNLTLYGHRVKVFEKHISPGGMLNQGIPPFRLPRSIIEKEIQQITALGVEIVCNTTIGSSITVSSLSQEYDAVIMAAGTLSPNIPDLPGKHLRNIHHGLDFLFDVHEREKKTIGKEVVVIGGGFTAMDCARTALRLQADAVKIYYRRSQKEMLVTKEEQEELTHENIPTFYQVSPKEYLGKDNAVGVGCIRTNMEKQEGKQRSCPVELPGSEFSVPASTILLATGQSPDISWLEEPYKTAFTDRKIGNNTLLYENVFIAGDFSLGATTLIDAIGHAKACARNVDSFLMQEERLTDVAFIENVASTNRDSKWNSTPRHQMPMIPLNERSVVAEVEKGYRRKTAEKEALRCYLCHYKFEIDNDLCIYCDGCLRVQPVENCIVKVNTLAYDQEDRIIDYTPSTTSMDYNILYIDQNKCIRCGACVEVCPVDCISLQKVSKKTVPLV